MRRVWHPFVLAFQFFTILPISLSSVPSERDMVRSAYYLPLVGLFLGSFVAGLQFTFLHLFRPELAAFLVVTLYVVSTGALHVDGFMDTMDAIGSRTRGDRALEIMKDSRVGAMGAIAAVLLLAGKWLALSSLQSGMLSAIWTVPLCSRTALLAAMTSTNAAKPTGLGALFARRTDRRLTALISVLVVILVLLNMPWSMALAILLSCGVTSVLCCIWFTRRFGGMTGDTYGAIVEMTEWMMWIAVVGTLGFH